MENETQEQEPEVEQVEQTSPLLQVSLLSKYFLIILFIALLLLGGYIGYTFAPEKVETLETMVEVERDNSADLNDNENLVAQNNLTQIGEIVHFPYSKGNSYYVSEPELIAQGYLDVSNRGNAPYFGYYDEMVVKVDDTHTILAISTNPAGFTNSYLINEAQKVVVRELKTGLRNINAISDWYDVEEGGMKTTYHLVLLDQRVLLVDYVNGVEEVLYNEDDQNISLLEMCKPGKCEGYIKRTLNGDVRVSRYSEISSNEEGVLWRQYVGEYIDTIEITIPDEYKPPMLRSGVSNTNAPEVSVRSNESVSQCEVDSDCVLVSPDCEDCQFAAIGTNAVDQFREEKRNRCELNPPQIMCDLVFTSEIKCIDNSCQIVE